MPNCIAASTRIGVGAQIADPRDRTVIVVDDGIATGASILAAVRALRAAGPEAIVVAVPVGPRSVCQALAQEADDVVCATMPDDFEAVGQVFADFHQVSDDEVRALLATPRARQVPNGCCGRADAVVGRDPGSGCAEVASASSAG